MLFFGGMGLGLKNIGLNGPKVTAHAKREDTKQNCKVFVGHLHSKHIPKIPTLISTLKALRIASFQTSCHDNAVFHSMCYYIF
jgi:hypothetical protein